MLACAAWPPGWRAYLIFMHRCASALFLIAAALWASAGPAGAATEREQARSVPYDGQLLRLAEILGALHYLRGICSADEGQTWRDQMQALIDAETPSGERRERMVASFNRGYLGFQQSYHLCTPAADLAIRRFLDEGVTITRDLAGRYAD